MSNEVRAHSNHMTSDAHRMYVIAACVYTCLGVKRHGGEMKKAERLATAARTYESQVAAGFLKWLVEDADHTPLANLDKAMMGRNTQNGESIPKVLPCKS